MLPATTNQDDQEAVVAWLLEAGSAIVRYRTYRDLLCKHSSKEHRQLREQVLAEPEVQQWLRNLENCRGLHNSGNGIFENIMGRLPDLGLDRCYPEVEKRLAPFRRQLESLLERDDGGGMFSMLNTVILALGLARAGYVDDAVVVEAARRRIADVAAAVGSMNFNIYLPEDEEPRKPKNFQHKRVLRPEYAPGGRCRLPYVYDIHLAAAFAPGRLGPQADDQLDAIIRYILHPAYQRLPAGYGILMNEQGGGRTRFYAIGWNVSLPGYHGGVLNRREKQVLILRLEALCRFPRARTSSWFRCVMEHLETFRDGNQHYLFPSDYLRQNKVGYWILGNHMRLQQTGHHKADRTVDSTFRMSLLNQVLGGA